MNHVLHSLLDKLNDSHFQHELMMAIYAALIVHLAFWTCQTSWSKFRH